MFFAIQDPNAYENNTPTSKVTSTIVFYEIFFSDAQKLKFP